MRDHRASYMEPHPGPTPENAEQAPDSGKSGTLRAAIFGLNDGLVSNLALIMGVAGAGVDNNVVLVAGIAGLLAGAFSMGAGEYVSMRVQREVFERYIHIEAHEIHADPEGETEELVQLYMKRGIPEEPARQAAEAIHADPVQALDVHAREELGLDQTALGSPTWAAVSSFVTFSLGASVPLIPFVFGSGVAAAAVAVALAITALFAAGAAMSILTARGWLLSGMRMVLIGGGATLVTFAIGRLLGVTALD